MDLTFIEKPIKLSINQMKNIKGGWMSCSELTGDCTGFTDTCDVFIGNCTNYSGVCGRFTTELMQFSVNK